MHGTAAVRLGVGLYGLNGHQIHAALAAHPRAELVAVAALPEAALAGLPAAAGIRRYADLAGLLSDPRVELVSLCSPRRADQTTDAIRCLAAGRHVYAEKPCALSEAELDAVLAAAAAAGRTFHEMAGTVFEQPYWAMRQLVRAGRIGDVVQVLVQKSYPWHEGRPQDEAVDGGLTAQVAIHGVRLVEQLTGQPVETVQALETALGNPGAGSLRMASTLQMRLRGGALATVIANYLNPRPTGVWGYEEVRVFGTDGLVESLEGGTRTRLVTSERDWGAVEAGESPPDYLGCLIAHLLDGTAMPVPLAEELHPTRIVLRARLDARRGS